MPLPKGDFIGQSGMLVRKHVLDKVGYPWFKCGQIDPGRLQEDLTFCRELQNFGYTIYVDQEIIFDHWVPMAITARRVGKEEKWVPGVSRGLGDVVLMPYSATKKNPLKVEENVSHDFNSPCDPRKSSIVDAGSQP